MLRCPTCRAEVKPRGENPSFPFCTPRCRAVDLGRWFTGEYRVAGEHAAQEAEKERGDEEPEKH
ncbi:MAG TPA: DNA gyrase inhibitor YacG [Myxococcales bacterium]|nr:DNA gyrase inhibitor YacG [Myxococcales bacterium]